jgi:hypothetical protein
VQRQYEIVFPKSHWRLLNSAIFVVGEYCHLTRTFQAYINAEVQNDDCLMEGTSHLILYNYEIRDNKRALDVANATEHSSSVHPRSYRYSTTKEKNEDLQDDTSEKHFVCAWSWVSRAYLNHLAHVGDSCGTVCIFHPALVHLPIPSYRPVWLATMSATPIHGRAKFLADESAARVSPRVGVKI